MESEKLLTKVFQALKTVKYVFGDQFLSSLL